MAQRGELGPPPSYRDAKKRAAEPLNQLPYQRKLTFRRRAYTGLEDMMHELFGRHTGTPMVRAVLGRVVGRDGQRDVVLPFDSEAVLEGGSHEFLPVLSSMAFERLRSIMEAQLPSGGGGAAQRWADVSVEDTVAEVPPEPQEQLTLFCPGGTWHYQVQVGSVVQPGMDTGVRRQRTELVYHFRKDANPGGLWWALALCSEGLECKLSAELRLNVQLLWDQHRRMQAGKAHSFSLLLRDLLRNARCLAAALRDAVSDADAPCYYPGLFEASVAVQQHYAQKAMQGDSNVPSASDNVRRYNNLIKTLLVERFVDPLLGPVRVLDVGCGRGQDLQKYSREFRKAQISSYVGLDFALEAVQEARRRYAKIARKGESQYLAAFYVGDLRDPASFDQLAGGGHTRFDVVSLQFTLQYLADSAETVRGLFAKLASLLRPGGRVIGCIPSSDVLLDLYSRPGSGPPEAPGAPRRRGNALYSVLFRGEAWSSVGQSEAELEEAFARRWGLPYAFSLVDAVDALEEYVVPWDALEELASSVGFRVMADAPFADVLAEYSSASPFYANFFSKDDRVAKLSPQEEELFGFYSCFVFERE